MRRIMHRQRGVGLLALLGILAVISMLAGALFTTTIEGFAGMRRLERSLQAMQLAEAGVEMAIHKIQKGSGPPDPNTLENLGVGSVQISITPGTENRFIVVSQAHVPANSPWITKTLKATIHRKEGTPVILEQVWER